MGRFGQNGHAIQLPEGENKIASGSRPLRFCLSKPLPANVFEGKHMVDAMTDISLAIGGRSDRGGLELVAGSKRWKNGMRLLPQPDGAWPRRVIGINPGSDGRTGVGLPEVCMGWPRAIGRRLRRQCSILGGPGEESAAHEIADNIRCPYLNLAGQLSSPSSYSRTFIICAIFLITNDSGPMHMAAALGITDCSACLARRTQPSSAPTLRPISIG